MTTKLKEKIVALSRNKRLEKIYAMYCCIVLAFVVVAFFVKGLQPTASVLVIVTWLAFLIYITFESIRKQTDEVINNNKLIYIVLSNRDAVMNYIEFIIVLPILGIISYFVELNFVTGAICLVVSVVIVIIPTNVISKHYKNKLSKNID